MRKRRAEARDADAQHTHVAEQQVEAVAAVLFEARGVHRWALPRLGDEEMGHATAGAPETQRVSRKGKLQCKGSNNIGGFCSQMFRWSLCKGLVTHRATQKAVPFSSLLINRTLY